MSKEMRFREAVQRSRVKQPSQVGFSVELWREYFGLCETNSDEDRKLFEAGLWFFGRFELIRKRLSELPNPAIGRENIRAAYVGFINRDFAVADIASKQYFRSRDDKHLWAPEIIEGLLPIGLGASPINVVGAIETEVSAIRYPLSETFKSKDELTTDPYCVLTDLKMLQNIIARVNLAILYDRLSDYWQECLWNEWSVVVGDKNDSIVPSACDKHMSRVVGEHRSSSLLLELTNRSIFAWRKLPPKTRQIVLDRQRVVKIRRTKGKMDIKLGHWKDTQFPPISLAAGLVAEELYWNDILKEPLPKIENATIREILAAWEVLASFGALMKDNTPKNTEVKNISKLMTFAQTFSKSQIIKVVCDATKIKEIKVASIIDLFTFDGNVRSDPWFKPIVPISDEKYTALIPALVVPNLIRSIEFWMKVGGIDLSERGGEFEKYVRADAVENLRNSKHMSRALVNTTSVNVTADGQREEIDFLMAIGTTIIVGEVKCLLSPASGFEFYKYFEVLDEAGLQAKRKADFISNNIEKVLGTLGQKIVGDSSNYVVLPIVINNLPLASGISLNGVPILDMYILRKYIDGEQEFFASINDQGGTESLIKKPYYSCEKEAESNMPSFLIHPPIISLLRSMITSRHIQLLPLEKGEKVMTVLHLHVGMPGEEATPNSERGV